jgi:FKBP-type peptidyl-prolyl cis-trans isomerase SlyD
LRRSEGFGPHDPNLTFTDDLDNVPPQFRFVGAEVPMQSENGEVKTFYVTRIENGRLTVDGNHPLRRQGPARPCAHPGGPRPTAEELAQDGGACPPGGSLH